MKKRTICLQLITLLIFSSPLYGTLPAFQKIARPHLEMQGKVTQLTVDGKHFIVRGGELGNSSFTSMEYMAPLWSKLKDLNLKRLFDSEI